ncbi:hypothetical protein BBB57_03275 [Kosakonia sacchari]|nr:hypothetical protein BBB57_03275 [Kosakonia sacchari]
MVNLARIKAIGTAKLLRRKIDKTDSTLLTRFSKVAVQRTGDMTPPVKDMSASAPSWISAQQQSEFCVLPAFRSVQIINFVTPA